MSSWLLAAILVAFAATLTTALPRETGVLERAFLGVAGTVVALAAASLALARLGLYSPLAASAPFAVAGIALHLRTRRPGAAAEAPIVVAQPPHESLALAALLVGFLAFNWTYPTLYLLGGRDPGLYLAFSAQIATTGGLDLDLPSLRDLAAHLGDSVHLGYPGIYSMRVEAGDPDPSHLVPQFMHLFPALAANAYGPFGLAGTIRVNTLVGALAVWAVFLVGRRWMPFWLAFAVAAGVASNPAVLFASRITYSEPLTVLIGFLGILLCFESLERRSTRMAATAGALLGLGVFARLDALFFLLVPAGVAFANLGAEPAVRKIARGLGVGSMLVAAAGLADGWLHARPYLRMLLDLGQLDRMAAFCFGVAMAGLVLSSVPRGWLGPEGRADRIVHTSGLGLALLWAGWLLHAGIVRPRLDPSSEARSLVELGWYVHPLVLVLGVLGAFSAMRSPRWRSAFPLVLLGTVTLVLYTWKPAVVVADHIWVSRRWVTHVIPLSFLFAGAFFAAPATNATRWARVTALSLGASALLLQGAEVWRMTRPFAFVPLLEGIDEDYRSIVAAIRDHPERRGVLTDEAHIASVLTYVWEVPTILASPPDDETSAARMEGFVFLSRKRGNPWIEPTEHFPVGGRYLERAVGRRPERLVARSHDVHLGVVGTDIGGREGRIASFAAAGLPTHTGGATTVRGALRSDGRRGFLHYGPYVRLRRGGYVARWYGIAAARCEVEVDVVTEEGAIQHAKRVVPIEVHPESRNLATLPFWLEAETEGVEFRMLVPEGSDITLDRIDLHTIGEGGLDPRLLERSPVDRKRNRPN